MSTSTTAKRTIYHTAFTHSLSLTQLEHASRALVCVGSAGIIEWIEKDVQAEQIDKVLADHEVQLGQDEAELVTISEGGLVPGLIDTHTHAPQYPNIGTGSRLELLDWLEQLTFPLEGKFSDMDFAKKVYPEVVKRNLELGTTTCCYYATIHEDSSKFLADTCLEQGQRALVGKCCMDRNSPADYIETAESSLQTTKSFIAHFETLPPPPQDQPPLVQPIITPRFALSCTGPLLHSLGELAQSQTPSIAIQTHLSENVKEIASTLSEFPDCEVYTEVYDKAGLVGDGTILAHCVHLEQKEMEILRDRKAGVSHCPVSNMNLNSGVAEVRKLLDMGIKVGLGTDCSGGYAMGILPTLRLASTLSRFRAFSDPAVKPLSIEELFYLATLGGASLCRLQDRIGSFEVGKEFDALWVKGQSINMWNEPGEEWTKTFERWLWCGDDRDIESVWVRGRKVVG